MRSLESRLGFALACSIAALSVACGGGHAQSCSANKDCPSPQVCAAGLCASPGCSGGLGTCAGDANCSAGQHCASGCCAAGAPGHCTSDADCLTRAGTPVCDTAAQACVQCLNARDCGSGKLCKSEVCVAQPGCGANADCTDAALPVCDTKARVCVQCLGAADCADPARPNCDVSHTCVPASGCTGDAQCASTPATPHCVTGTGNCAACNVDKDCLAGQTCSSAHTCVTPASSCTSDKECSAPKAHCTSTGATPGICVQCTGDAQCPGQVCAGDDTCQSKQCSGDPDCAQVAGAPRCNTAGRPAVCVACLGDGDCPGGTCQPDHTCAAGPLQCQGDTDCKVPGLPHCDTALTPHACVACVTASDCKAGQLCTAQNTCATATCQGNGDCVKPTPFCTGPGGLCVACTQTSQCGAGNRCSAQNTCVPVCTAATQATDCAAPTPVCKESPAGNACVQCVHDGDCAKGDICSTGNTCIPAPDPNCTTNADCPAGAHVCDTSTTPHQCVQCLATSDCPSPDVCSTAAKTCVPPPTGADGEACNADGSCNSGLVCVGEPAGLICRTRCNPYAAGSCAAVGTDRVCSWTAFDASGALQGICEPKSGRGTAGTACDPNLGDGCEWDLFCAPTSATAGVCAALCNPAAPSCASGTCNHVVGAVGASGAPLTLGLCGSASKWGAACVTDTGSAGADCGSATSLAGTGAGLFCTPSLLPAENPSRSILGICQFTPAVATARGGAGADCALGDNYCRTGLCLLDGSVTCFAGCAATADCSRDGSSTARCLDVGFSVDDGSGDTARGVVASCLPPCLNDASCPSGGGGRSCQPQSTHNGSSWSAACGPVFGAGHGGAQCSHDSDCNSGTCITAATLLQFGLGLPPPAGFVATDGYCLGACNECNGPDVVASTTCPSPGAVSDCDATSTCDGVAALPLNPSDGNLGIVGYADATSTSGVCFGTGCLSDVDCAGLSADASTPRVCAPYKQVRAATNDTTKSCTVDTDCTSIKSAYPTAVCNTAANNPNPRSVYGVSAGIFGRNGHCRQVGYGLQCQPSLGAKLGAAGATCSTNASCQSGYCATTASGGGVCYGPCLDDSDCTSTSTHCLAGSFLGITSDYCQ